MVLINKVVLDAKNNAAKNKPNFVVAVSMIKIVCLTEDVQQREQKVGGSIKRMSNRAVSKICSKVC